MDRCHEFGLITYWEDHQLDDGSFSRCAVIEEEKIYLNFFEIYPFFLILAIGFSIALLTLLGELFYHDFWSQLSEDYFKRKFGWLRRTKKQKLKVRILKVKSNRTQPTKSQNVDADQKSDCP